MEPRFPVAGPPSSGDTPSIATAAAPGPPRRQRSRISLTLLLALALLSLYFPTRQHSRAVSLLLHVSDPNATGILADYDTRPVGVIATTIDGPAGPVRAKLYVPEGVEDPPAMVVLHGVHHLGIEEPRLVRFSRALASHGIVILTPEMADLADYHVAPNAIEVIGASVHDLARRTGAKTVGLLGLSFAGGLALVAASDERFDDEIGYVVPIGAHHDLARVLRFYATNQILRPDGSVLSTQAHEYGPLVVAYSHPEVFFAPTDLESAREAIRLWLWEKRDAARAKAQRLSTPGREKLAKLFDHRLDVLAPELMSAIAKHRDTVSLVSPAGKMDKLRCPVFLVHGAGDNVIPPPETLWLARETPRHLLRETLISAAISHVEVGGSGPTLRDKLNLVHFMAEMLSEADAGPRSTVPARQLLQSGSTQSTHAWSH